MPSTTILSSFFLITRAKLSRALNATMLPTQKALKKRFSSKLRCQISNVDSKLSGENLLEEI